MLGLAPWRSGKSRSLQRRHPIETLVRVPAGPLLIRLPVTVPGMAVEDNPSAWASEMHAGDAREAPGPCSQMGSKPKIKVYFLGS